MCIKVCGQTPSWIWVNGISASENDFGRSICTDSNGDVYVTGFFNSANFGGFANAGVGSNDIFIRKYNAAGNLIFKKHISGSGDDYCTKITTDISSNFYVAGAFMSDSLIIDTITVHNSGINSRDLFLAKFNSAGTVLWVKTAKGNGEDLVISVATDSTNNVYVAGTFKSDTLQIDTLEIINSGGQDVFTAKFDSSGNINFINSVNGSADEVATSIAIDSSGNYLIGGGFHATSLDFGGFILNHSNTPNQDGFIAKYNTLGSILWAKNISGGIVLCDVAVDEAQNVYATGSFLIQAAVFDTITLTGGPSIQLFLAKYDNNGKILWAKKPTGQGGDRGVSLCSKNGYIYLSGVYCSSPLMFDGDTLLNPGGFEGELLVVKYDTTGHVLWCKGAGEGDDYETAVGIAVSDNGNLFITGSYESDPAKFDNIFLYKLGPYYTADFFVARLDNTTEIAKVQKKQNEIYIYPNPSHTNINFIAEASAEEKLIQIVNSLGKVIYTTTLKAHDAEKLFTIATENLITGIYFLRIFDSENSLTQKFVVD